MAAGGFRLTPYLAGAIAEHAGILAADPGMAALFVPEGRPVAAGERLVQGDYAESLRLIAREGAAALHGGALGAALAARIVQGKPDDGYLTEADLAAARAIDRTAIVGHYRGYEIVGPPPPGSSGVHIAEMLNILEGFDVAALGFGTPEALHLLAQVLTIGFADRRLSSGDPAFVDVPVERLISKAYAAARRAELGTVPPAPMTAQGSADTTHVTVADRDGTIVSATHTINGLFGAKFVVPGTGMIPNNYMMNFDPHPGRALSVAPGKRVPTSMAPMIVTRDGRPAFALGLPGALRIFPSAFQAIVNVIDHDMTLQEAVEAPRLFTEGHVVELEKGYGGAVEALEAMGHEVAIVPHVAGGMNAVGFARGRYDDGGRLLARRRDSGGDGRRLGPPGRALLYRHRPRYRSVGPSRGLPFMSETRRLSRPDERSTSHAAAAADAGAVHPHHRRQPRTGGPTRRHPCRPFRSDRRRAGDRRDDARRRRQPPARRPQMGRRLR